MKRVARSGKSPDESFFPFLPAHRITPTATSRSFCNIFSLSPIPKILPTAVNIFTCERRSVRTAVTPSGLKPWRSGAGSGGGRCWATGRRDRPDVEEHDLRPSPSSLPHWPHAAAIHGRRSGLCLTHPGVAQRREASRDRNKDGSRQTKPERLERRGQ